MQYGIATNTVITPKVLKELSLTIVDIATIVGVNSEPKYAQVALFNLLLPNNVSIKGVRGSVCTIGGNADILIGMHNNYTFLLNNINYRLLFLLF